MNYYDFDDFYDESVNSELDEFVDSLKNRAKKEFIDRLNKLEEENARLQDIKENYDTKIRQLENEYSDKKYQLEKEYRDKEYKLYRRPIEEIFPFVSKPYYRASTKYDYIPKCDKCNEDRQFVYVDPLGEKHTFDCTCNKRDFTGYEVEEKLINFISEISIRDNKPCMWVAFNISKSSNGDYISGTFFDKDKVILSGKVDEPIHKYSLKDKIGKYEPLEYYFESKEDCEKFVSFLNDNFDKIKS